MPVGFFWLPFALKHRNLPRGKILHRGWDWNGKANSYLHVVDWSLERATPTDAMRETVEGLFSGRIKVDGLKIAVGASVQKAVSGIDIAVEEGRVGKRIFLA